MCIICLKTSSFYYLSLGVSLPQKVKKTVHLSLLFEALQGLRGCSVDDFARISKNCKMSEKAIFLARFARPLCKSCRTFALKK